MPKKYFCVFSISLVVLFYLDFCRGQSNSSLDQIKNNATDQTKNNTRDQDNSNHLIPVEVINLINTIRNVLDTILPLTPLGPLWAAFKISIQSIMTVEDAFVFMIEVVDNIIKLFSNDDNTNSPIPNSLWDSTEIYNQRHIFKLTFKTDCKDENQVVYNLKFNPIVKALKRKLKYRPTDLYMLLKLWNFSNQNMSWGALRHSTLLFPPPPPNFKLKTWK